jgi:fructose-bisphosphate aldolase class I
MGIELSPEHFVVGRLTATPAIVADDRRVHRSGRSSNPAAAGKTQQSRLRPGWYLAVGWDHIRTDGFDDSARLAGRSYMIRSGGSGGTLPGPNLFQCSKNDHPEETSMNLSDLNKVAQAMVAPGKGLLAADESTGTIKKRFDAIKVESTEDSRRDYREMLFRSKEAMSKYISGVILYDETIWQKAKDGTPLVKLIEQAGAIPGIKVDEGTQALPGCPGELVTVGLDKLAERLAAYYKQGARFAKWRAVIDIGRDIPSMTAIHVNAHALARYAALCQAAQIVPIVEPEVLMDGDHDIERCYDVTRRVLNKVFQELRIQRVALEGMILKPNMVVPGMKSAKQVPAAQVAEQTIRLLKECVPAAVPGIMFLSGGQSDEDATAHLDAMHRIGGLPWGLSFSYGRALQAAPQKAWSGKAENVAAGQAAFTHRARMNSLAAKGEWQADLEQKKAA